MKLFMYIRCVTSPCLISKAEAGYDKTIANNAENGIIKIIFSKSIPSIKLNMQNITGNATHNAI